MDVGDYIIKQQNSAKYLLFTCVFPQFILVDWCMFLLTAKEIHLKHQSPVIGVCIIDRGAVPLPAPFEVENECARPPDMSGGHSVVICSEEQLKVSALKWILCQTENCLRDSSAHIQCPDQRNTSLPQLSPTHMPQCVASSIICHPFAVTTFHQDWFPSLGTCCLQLTFTSPSLTVFKLRLTTHLSQLAYNDEHWLTWPDLLCYCL